MSYMKPARLSPSSFLAHVRYYLTDWRDTFREFPKNYRWHRKMQLWEREFGPGFFGVRHIRRSKRPGRLAAFHWSLASPNPHVGCDIRASGVSRWALTRPLEVKVPDSINQTPALKRMMGL